jgi:hypothetical protein
MASRQNKRKPSTFVQRTNAHFKAIERQLNPQPTFGSIEGDPPAITNHGKFIDRVVLVENESNLTIGAISRALRSTGFTSSGPSGDFFIRSIKVWGIPSSTTDGPLVAKFLLESLVANAGGGADPVVVRDFGTASRRPGIRCTIPLPASKLQNFDTGSTVVVAELGNKHDCIHVSVRQKL